MLQAGRSRDRVAMRWIFSVYLILPAALALRLNQPLTEISTSNFSGGKGWQARKAENLTAICEPIV
jgi:hypothetical protein